MKFTQFIFLITLLLLGCQSEKQVTKILILGDVQLKGDLRKYAEEDWLEQQLDTATFHPLFHEVLEKESPDYIIQTGDWVNNNDNFYLDIYDTLEQQLAKHPIPYSEWDYMNRQIPEVLKDKFFIAYGNHESYQNVILRGIFHPRYDILGDVKLAELTLEAPTSKKQKLIKHFPHLCNATFHGSTATYFVENRHFSLLSIDGLDKSRAPLLTFIDSVLTRASKLSKPVFVISHYPIFTGREIADDEKLVYHDIRDELINLFDQYKVPFFFNGHEHFYLRYTRKGQQIHFEPPYPDYTEYLTISDFANPYSREAKRIESDTIQENRTYFKGTHYAVIELTGSNIQYKSYGYENGNWVLIEEL